MSDPPSPSPPEPTSAPEQSKPGEASPLSSPGQYEASGGSGRRRRDVAFQVACIATASSSIGILVWLLWSILREGLPWLDVAFLTSPPDPDPLDAGIRPAIFGTIWVVAICSLITVPIGIATAILLEEFRPKSRIGNWIYSLIQINISNLAGVPSVVYGILGLTAFVSMFQLFVREDAPGEPWAQIGATYYDQFFTEGSRSAFIPVPGPDAPITEPVDGMEALMFAVDADGQSIIDYGAAIPVNLKVISPDDEYPEDAAVLSRTLFDDAEAGRVSDEAFYHLRLPLGRGVMAGALTLMLVILPVVIIASQEALRAVPSSLRDGARGLGATPWQVVWNVTLPAAIPGIMTGSILAVSRAIGETAPLLIIAGIVYIRSAPQHLMDDFTVLPLQIYNWVSRPQEDFHHIAAAGIIVLLVILLSFNAVAVLIRQTRQRPLS